MADRYNEKIEAPSYQWAAALFHYMSGTGYAKITQSLKYHADMDAGRHYAHMLGERLRDAEEFSDVSCIIPVPLHWTRLWKRGYNQAEVIARELGSALGAPVTGSCLARVRRTMTQTRMSVGEKARNVEGAFAVRGNNPEGGHVLLVDDVFTTGATLASCYGALRKAGYSGRISAATLAFVG